MAQHFARKLALLSKGQAFVTATAAQNADPSTQTPSPASSVTEDSAEDSDVGGESSGFLSARDDDENQNPEALKGVDGLESKGLLSELARIESRLAELAGDTDPIARVMALIGQEQAAGMTSQTLQTLRQTAAAVHNLSAERDSNVARLEWATQEQQRLQVRGESFRVSGF